jgi:hypothetical protein
MLTLFAPLLKVRQVLRRWSTTHVPVVVKPRDYLRVVGRIEKALADEGLPTQRQHASALIRLPTKLLTALAGRAFATLVADRLTVLKGKDLEVMLHPADLVISGKERSVIQARIAVAERLVFSEANQTWTKEASEIEDALAGLWNDMRAKGVEFSTTIAPSRLKGIREQLHDTPLPFEEWEVLTRGIARIDEAILALAAGVIRVPEEVEAMNGEPAAARLRAPERLRRERGMVGIAAALGVLLIALLTRKVPEAREVLTPGNLLAIARMFVR